MLLKKKTDIVEKHKTLYEYIQSQREIEKLDSMKILHETSSGELIDQASFILNFLEDNMCQGDFPKIVLKHLSFGISLDATDIVFESCSSD
jgi:hypothetical protein